MPTAESDWPTLDEILGFRDRVRARLQGIYKQLESGKMAFSHHIGRVLFMTFEHEAMHAETLLYMLIQSESTRPPAAVATPQWDVLAHRWADEAVPKRVIFIEGGTVALGHHDLESEDEAYPKRDGWEDHEYGWDNEHPAAATPVKSFKVDSLPITNDDYKAFLGDSHDFPASWIEVDGKLMVRTLYGPVDFDVAGLWPLMASKIEIDAFAKSKGGRLPTEAELRFFWAHPEGSRPAGELSNVGVKNWHPVP